MNIELECAISKILKHKLIEVKDLVGVHNNFLSIDYFGLNSIVAINKMLPDDPIVNQIIGDTYHCYYTSNHMGVKFYRVVPSYILTDDVGKYFDLFPDNYNIQMFRDMACDPEWNVPEWEHNSPTLIQRTLLGSGFVTDSFNGSPDVREIAVKLDNGDHLVCFFNCFFHK